MKLAVLAGPGLTTHMLIHALVDCGVQNITVLMEQPQSRKRLIRNRVRRLGLFTALGQLTFQGLVSPLLSHRARLRIKAILADHGLNGAVPPPGLVEQVTSVNAVQTRVRLLELNPDLILVNGTRIISAKLLNAFAVPFLNTHLGITPAYRGVHGGYWALWQRDPDRFGATVHLVDPGVDTGGVVIQRTGAPGPQDTFATYPILQQALILPAICDLVRQFEDTGAMPPAKQSDEVGRQYYHPTIWQYLDGRLRGVR